MNDLSILGRKFNSFMFKILMIGEASVGKTSLKMRYTDNFFNAHNLSTIGVDYKIKCLQFGKDLVKLSIWDTAGSEKYRAIAKSYFKNSNAILLCFDLTNRKSFIELNSFWYNWIKENQGNEIFREAICKLYIVATKLDEVDNRIVNYEEGKAFAQSINASYFETSAKSNVNVTELFTEVASDLLQEYRTMQPSISRSTIVLDCPDKYLSSKNRCC